MSGRNWKLRERLPVAAWRCELAWIAPSAKVVAGLIRQLADAARAAWVWVRQPANDPVVRARTAFKRIKARGEVPGLPWLVSDVSTALRDRQGLTAALHLVSEDEEALVYLLIAKLAYERLQSRQHHVAQGRLSPTGHQIHSAYKHAAARLIQFGVYDQATYEEDCALLKQEISEIG